jgi:hypothetical protein
MMIKNGIRVNNKLKTAATMADKGKQKGCKLIDFKMAALSINEVKTCNIDAEIKFQKIKPVNAYKAKCSIWLICLKTIIRMVKNIKGLSMLQKTPRKEFLYRSLMVLSAKLKTAF